MEKEKEAILFSRPGDAGRSSVIRAGITLPDDSNGNRGQLTQRADGTLVQRAHCDCSYLPVTALMHVWVRLYVCLIVSVLRVTLRQQVSLLANVSALGRSRGEGWGGPCLFEFYHFLFTNPFSCLFTKTSQPSPGTSGGALTSAKQRGSDHQQYPQSQHISASAAICPLYCIQLPPAFNLMQEQLPLFFFFSSAFPLSRHFPVSDFHTLANFNHLPRNSCVFWTMMRFTLKPGRAWSSIISSNLDIRVFLIR